MPEIDEYQTASSTVSDIAGDVAGLNSQVGSSGGCGGVGDCGGNGISDGSVINANKKNSLSHQESIDYDALYEEEEDTSISMEAHGSMISHLLSQVKIGMDLTKVVLPTFILERRSLLEMYADYFAHPDLFLKYVVLLQTFSILITNNILTILSRIADLDSPRDRIVQVCRWYLSAYHAGRKSAVAKKPYNPILGEVFQCYWDIPGKFSIFLILE